MKEFFRKLMVSLKRRPQNIPFVAMIISFIFYSLNMTRISDTTAKISGANMGLCGFGTMLFSILVFVTFLNSFPRRKRPNYVMIVLTYVMLTIIIVCDINYRNCIVRFCANEKFKDVALQPQNAYILKAQSVVTAHVVITIVIALLIALIPVYGRLLKKVNTSIDVEYSGKMDAIDIEE